MRSSKMKNSMRTTKYSPLKKLFSEIIKSAFVWHNEVNYSLSGRWKLQGVSHFCELLLNTHINYIGFTSVKLLSGGCLRILLIEYNVSTEIDFCSLFL